MKERLATRDYFFMLTANLLLYFGFWLPVPILPFYLSENYTTSNFLIGFVLSCYTIAALCIRPFSGYLLDALPRKPLYLISFCLFTLVFGGYMIAATLAFFIILRVVHGLAFGVVTVSGNTVVIDIMPSSRRGEGLGYYGLTNNIGMAIGPTVGLFMHDAGIPFSHIFACGLGVCFLGFIFASFVNTPYRPPVKKEPLSLDRFVLIKGIPPGVVLLMLSVPFGITSNFVAIYAQQIGITGHAGLFFTFMAVGMAVSRIFGGKWVDRGKITEVISVGLYIVVLAFFLLAACSLTSQWDHTLTLILFFSIAFLLGVGFGMMFPAFNTLFVNLAPNSMRGTAVSTYLTSWDIGIGIGMLGGGFIADICNFGIAFLFGASLTVISLFYFRMKVAAFYNKNKMR